MYARQAQPLSRQPARRPELSRTAVVLNASAKRVNARVRAAVEAAAVDADIYYTRSLEEAQAVTGRVARLGYPRVVTGGGDGTVINTIDNVVRAIDELGTGRYPRFGVLRLGTGNAVADHLGARDFRRDLAELHGARTKRVDLLRLDDGHLTTFAGFGWDAFILRNYEMLKDRARAFWPTRVAMGSVLGYLLAGVGYSVPLLALQRPRWRVRVINRGGMAFRLDVDGNVIERYAPGTEVFNGEVVVATLGTIPFYGFKFKIMPHADRWPGMFQLRLLDMHPFAAVWNLRKAWKGTMTSGVCDLQMSGCELIFDRPTPFQIGGDAAGQRERLRVGMHEHGLECFHF